MSEAERPRLDDGSLRSIRPHEYVIRFLFGAGVALVAALIGQLATVRAGGILLAFPAILPATLTLIQKKEGRRRAQEDDIGAIAGAVGLVAFALIGWLALTVFSSSGPVALAAAFVAWALTSVAPFVAAGAWHAVGHRASARAARKRRKSIE